MPDRPEDFDGLGRIPLVRSEISRGHWKSLRDLRRLTTQEFLDNTAYGWSWAACEFLDGHPRYGPRFRELGKHTLGSEFRPTFERLYGADLQDMETEWALFTHQLEFGFDLKLAAIEFKSGQPLTAGESRSRVEVAANRGWQSSGIAVKQGVRYHIDASGEVVLAKDPKPWISQPQGISIVYSEGRPIGTLLAAVHREQADDANQASMLQEIVVGRKNTFTASTSGTLYFRINDRWDSLANNHGRYQIVVRELSNQRD
jgi:hypothetical protein